MGHKRKASAPSPLMLLSILEARERGIPMPEIARRTKHSISSIMRWHEKFGHETNFFKALMAKMPDVSEKLRFEVLFPDRPVSLAPEPKLHPDGSVQYSNSVENPPAETSNKASLAVPGDIARILGLRHQ